MGGVLSNLPTLTGMRRDAKLQDISEEIPPAKPQQPADIPIEDQIFDENDLKSVTKIQACFRGHKARKELTNVPEVAPEVKPVKEVIKSAVVSEVRVAEMSAQKAEIESNKAEMEAEFSADDKELCHAATKIQASFRGHQVRRQAEKAVEKEVEDLSAKGNNELPSIDITEENIAWNPGPYQAYEPCLGESCEKKTNAFVPSENLENPLGDLKSGLNQFLVERQLANIPNDQLDGFNNPEQPSFDNFADFKPEYFQNHETHSDNGPNLENNPFYNERANTDPIKRTINADFDLKKYNIENHYLVPEQRSESIQNNRLHSAKNYLPEARRELNYDDNRSGQSFPGSIQARSAYNSAKSDYRNDHDSFNFGEDEDYHSEEFLDDSHHSDIFDVPNEEDHLDALDVRSGSGKHDRIESSKKMDLPINRYLSYRKLSPNANPRKSEENQFDYMEDPTYKPSSKKIGILGKPKFRRPLSDHNYFKEPRQGTNDFLDSTEEHDSIETNINRRHQSDYVNHDHLYDTTRHENILFPIPKTNKNYLTVLAKDPDIYATTHPGHETILIPKSNKKYVRVLSKDSNINDHSYDVTHHEDEIFPIPKRYKNYVAVVAKQPTDDLYDTTYHEDDIFPIPKSNKKYLTVIAKHPIHHDDLGDLYDIHHEDDIFPVPKSNKKYVTVLAKDPTNIRSRPIRVQNLRNQHYPKDSPLPKSYKKYLNFLRTGENPPGRGSSLRKYKHHYGEPNVKMTNQNIPKNHLTYIQTHPKEHDFSRTSNGNLQNDNPRVSKKYRDKLKRLERLYPNMHPIAGDSVRINEKYISGDPANGSNELLASKVRSKKPKTHNSKYYANYLRRLAQEYPDDTREQNKLKRISNKLELQDDKDTETNGAGLIDMAIDRKGFENKFSNPRVRQKTDKITGNKSSNLIHLRQKPDKKPHPGDEILDILLNAKSAKNDLYDGFEDKIKKILEMLGHNEDQTPNEDERKIYKPEITEYNSLPSQRQNSTHENPLREETMHDTIPPSVSHFQSENISLIEPSQIQKYNVSSRDSINEKNVNSESVVSIDKPKSSNLLDQPLKSDGEIKRQKEIDGEPKLRQNSDNSIKEPKSGHEKDKPEYLVNEDNSEDLVNDMNLRNKLGDVPNLWQKNTTSIEESNLGRNLNNSGDGTNTQQPFKDVLNNGQSEKITDEPRGEPNFIKDSEKYVDKTNVSQNAFGLVDEPTLREKLKSDDSKNTKKFLNPNLEHSLDKSSGSQEYKASLNEPNLGQSDYFLGEPKSKHKADILEQPINTDEPVNLNNEKDIQQSGVILDEPKSSLNDDIFVKPNTTEKFYKSDDLFDDLNKNQKNLTLPDDNKFRQNAEILLNKTSNTGQSIDPFYEPPKSEELLEYNSRKNADFLDKPNMTDNPVASYESDDLIVEPNQNRINHAPPNETKLRQHANILLDKPSKTEKSPDSSYESHKSEELLEHKSREIADVLKENNMTEKSLNLNDEPITRHNDLIDEPNQNHKNNTSLEETKLREHAEKPLDSPNLNYESSETANSNEKSDVRKKGNESLGVSNEKPKISNYKSFIRKKFIDILDKLNLSRKFQNPLREIKIRGYTNKSYVEPNVRQKLQSSKDYVTGIYNKTEDLLDEPNTRNSNHVSDIPQKSNESNVKEEPLNSYHGSDTLRKSSESFDDFDVIEKPLNSINESYIRQKSSESLDESNVKEEQLNSTDESDVRQKSNESLDDSNIKEKPMNSNNESDIRQKSNDTFDEFNVKEKPLNSNNESDIRQKSNESLDESNAKEKSLISNHESNVRQKSNVSYDESNAKEKALYSNHESNVLQKSFESLDESDAKEKSLNSNHESNVRQKSNESLDDKENPLNFDHELNTRQKFNESLDESAEDKPLNSDLESNVRQKTKETLDEPNVNVGENSTIPMYESPVGQNENEFPVEINLSGESYSLRKPNDLLDEVNVGQYNQEPGIRKKGNELPGESIDNREIFSHIQNTENGDIIVDSKRRLLDATRDFSNHYISFLRRLAILHPEINADSKQNSPEVSKERKNCKDTEIHKSTMIDEIAIQVVKSIYDIIESRLAKIKEDVLNTETDSENDNLVRTKPAQPITTVSESKNPPNSEEERIGKELEGAETTHDSGDGRKTYNLGEERIIVYNLGEKRQPKNKEAERKTNDLGDEQNALILREKKIDDILEQERKIYHLGDEEMGDNLGEGKKAGSLGVEEKSHILEENLRETDDLEEDERAGKEVNKA